MSDSVKGTTNDEFTLNLDLAPTILKAAGIPVPDKMNGRDMSELYLSPGRTDWRTEFFYEHPIVSTKWCKSLLCYVLIVLIALLQTLTLLFAPDVPASEALVRKVR